MEHCFGRTSMRKLLILFILTAISFAFLQNSSIPKVAVNSVILAQGDELILSASNLLEGSYKLVLNSPSGQVISQNIDSIDGKLDYKLKLDESGNWAINFSGGGLDTLMQVSVMPLSNPESSASKEINAAVADSENTVVEVNTANEAINTDNSTTDTQAINGAETSISTDNTEAETSANTNILTGQTPSLTNIIQEAMPDNDDSEAGQNVAPVSDTEVISTETTVASPEVSPETTEATSPSEASDTNSTEAIGNANPTELSLNTQTENTEMTEQASTEVNTLNTQAQSTETTEATNTENTTTEAIEPTNEVQSTETNEVLNNELATENTTTSPESNTETNTETNELAVESTTTNPVEESISTTETNTEATEVLDNEAETTEPMNTDTSSSPTQEEAVFANPTTTEAQVFAPLSGAPIDFAIVDSKLIAKQSEKPIWQLDFAKNSGDTAGNIIKQDDFVYLGHGNSLLRIDSKTGKVLARWLLSGQITAITENADGIAIDVKIDDGNSENFVLRGNNLDRAAHFSTDPKLYTWLENEANVSNPAARLAQDPTNPWLYLKAGQANPDPAEAKSLFNNAIDTTNSFYDAAGISQQLLEAGQNSLSTKAFSKSLSDFAARGYDPRLVTDMKLHDSYNFPLKAFNSAIAKGDLSKAAILAEQVKYFLSPNSPEIRSALVNYADLLKKNGNKDEANSWRKIAKSSNKTTVSNILDKIFASLAGVAWYAALATLLSSLALHLVLLFKYWRPQSVMLNRKREAGKKPSPLARLFAIRYYSTTEKLVLGLILASTVLLAGLGAWHDKASNLPKAIASGSYANKSVQSFINTANLSAQQGDFIKGYTAQVNNKTTDAEKYYQAAGNFPQALNNLAALTGDNSFVTKALTYAKNLPEALYNSGKEVEGFDFQKDFLPGKAVLSVPTNEDFQAALSGSWQDAVAKTFTSTYLLNTTPFGLNSIVWKIILGLFAIYTLLSLLWILWPRPRMARNAPRSFLYNIFSFLVPGSGMADEMWGILLLLPWAIFGLDAISRFFGLGFAINGLSLRLDYFVLGAIYIINLVAIVVEFLSYRQRMNKLKEEDLDLAREFNLI